MNFVGRAEIIESIQSRIAMGQMSLCVVYGRASQWQILCGFPASCAVIRRYTWRVAWLMKQSM